MLNTVNSVPDFQPLPRFRAFEYAENPDFVWCEYQRSTVMILDGVTAIDGGRIKTRWDFLPWDKRVAWSSSMDSGGV